MRKSSLSIVFAALACCGFVFNAQAARYAKLTVTAGEGGTVAASQSKNSAGTYGKTATTSPSYTSNYGNPSLFTTYAFAKADTDYVFMGWSESKGGTVTSTDNPLTVTISVSNSNNTSGKAAQAARYANFAKAVCKVDSKPYADVQQAMNDIQNGQTLTLLADFPIPMEVPIAKNITIDGNGHTLTRTSATAKLTISAAVTLKNITVDGQNLVSQNALFDVTSAGTLTVQNGAVIKDCKATSGNGGAILNAGTVKIAGGTISGCSTTGLGGAIYNNAGTITMTAGTIDGCSSNGGGAINQQGNGTTTISGGTVKNCTAGTGNSGGVARIVGGTFTITGGTFTGNKSTSSSGGGAFFLNTGTLNISGGTITGNTVTGANATGGAIYCYRNMTALNLSGSPKITGNTNAKGEADNIAVNDQTAKVVQSGNLTSGAEIGIHFPAEDPDGVVFGATTSSYTGAEKFFYDGDTTLTGVKQGTALAWPVRAVAQIGATKYRTLAESVAAAKDGDTIELLTNVKLDADVTIDKNVTLTSAAGKSYTLTRTADTQLNVATGALTLTNLAVDGAQMAATKPLVNVAAGATLNLTTGARVTSATAGGIAAAGTVNVSGNPVVTGNTAAGKASDLVPASANVLNLVGDFTGSIGVLWPRDVAGKELSGRPFGAATTFAGAEKFFFDGQSGVMGAISEDGRLAWPEIKEEVIPMGDDAVVYEGASSATTLPDGDVVLVFDDPSKLNTFTLPKNAKARILVVGGGGAGGSIGMDVNGAAGGGGAGGFIDREQTLDPGTYTVQLGAGGKRVQTVVQSWVGDDGDYSCIKLVDDIVALAKGGGGGGTVKIGGNGTEGGSGGGGAWYGKALVGGLGTEGQGRAGGTPQDQDHGGGGGGAAMAGGVNGTAGTGKTSDITGEVVTYAQGGRGGDKADAAYEAKAGAGAGFGGDGAVKGFGGAGADGLVIVRIHKLFDYVKVPYPEYVDDFVWESGKTRTAFDLNAQNAEFKAAIAELKGTNSVTCTGTDDDMEGLGRYNFVLYLNDGYMWEDGSLDPFGATWRIKDPAVIGKASIDVKKTVSWTEGADATISIDVHSTPEAKKATPNVLFIAGLCSAHGFSQEVLNAAFDAVTAVANLDYYFYNKTTDTPSYTGSLSVGEKFNKTINMESNNHGCLYGFYDALRKARSSGKTYDYIIFAFDRTKVATDFPNSQPTDEAKVVEWLKPFYEKNAVIWLVDNDPVDDTTHTITQTPWFPSQLVYQSGGTNGNKWKSLYDYARDVSSITDTARTFNAWRALMGVFCPSKYSQCTTTRYTQNSNHIIANSKDTVATEAQTRTRVSNLGGDAIENQVVYNNAKNVATIIAEVIKPVIHTVGLDDNVCVNMGLDVKDAYGEWTTNETTMGWKPLTDTELLITETGVSIELPGIQDEAWIHLDIAVEDTGLFKSSINATYNERTGLWEKDPNDGPVTVQLTPKGGTKIVAQDQAKTEVAWSYEAFKITGEVVHGEGEFIINGFIVDEESGIDFKNDGIALSKGYSPEVVFRGKPGWILDYLEIDGVQEPFTMETYNKIFENIAENHDVKVGFKNILVEKPWPGTAPYVHLYDGDAYGCLITSTPNFTDDLTFEWWPVYSQESNGVYSVDGGQIEVVRDADGNVIPRDVFVRIAIKQPGYEDPVVLDSWTGVNTVTILPRPIEISIDNQYQTGSTQIPKSSFTFEQLNGQLLEGDEIVVDYSCTYPTTQGGNAPINGTAKIIRTNSDGTKTDVTNNYDITVNPGTYYYPKSNQVMANAPDVVKYYDGQATDIDVTVTNPTKAPTQAEIKAMKGNSNQYNNIRNGNETKKILYSTDGVNWSEAEPTFTDVGEYTVYYKVTYRYDFEHSRYGMSYSKDSIEYESFESSAKIVIKPREVVVTAGSAEKIYDGTALTQPNYTVTPSDDLNGKGFADGEGFTSLNMTAGSTITNPGTVANVADAEHATFIAGTDLKNYNITYVDGSLTVTQNPLKASSSNNEKTYDGEPINWTGVNVTDKDGQPLASGYTIYYKTEPNGPWTTTPPELPTDAGEYPIFWKVDGGEGRGVVEDVSVLTIKSRTVTLVAGDAEQDYTGTPLTCTDFTVKPGTGDDYGFIPGEGVTAVVMTKDSTITDPGKTANKIDTGAVGQWTFLGDTKPQNYTFVVEDGTLKVNWSKEIRVTGPGTLTWTEQITVPEDAGEDDVFLTITIDGGDPIEVAKGNMNDPKLEKLVFGGETNIEHVVAFSYTNDYGPQATCMVSEEVWVPYDTNIAPALKDDPSAADFVITNLGTDPEQFNKGTTIHNGEPLVTVGLLDEDGVQTNDVVNTTTDANTKGTEDYWYVVPDPRGGENTVAMTAPTLETNEVVTLTVTVTGDGEFSWDSLLQTTAGDGKHPANITVVVDGQTNQVYGAEEDWTKHTIHVTDEPGKDGAEHLIEIIYTQDGDDSSSVGYLDNLTWTPSATREEMYEVVDNDPPMSAEEEQKYITIVNGPESGWMPAKDEDGNITGVRSPDGTEGTSSTNDLDSVFKIGVVGSGEIKIDTITIPVKNPEDPSRNPDGGLLTITVDDHVFEIPPIPDDSVKYTITTNGDTIVIKNLIIQVTGDPDAPHTVTFEYTRDADDPTGNTAAVIDHITWKSYGEREEGGSSWLQGKALWIIDHEDPGDGWVYLAFEPELKVEEELNAWVTRSDENDMIRVKYGETRAEADACTPVIAHLSTKEGHEVRPTKVWIKVSLNDLNQVTVVKPVGYWRI
ncbi:MAG: hypothetical protein MJ240_02760, partial [Kiritimatiellae bacterium]|nr:hypothetical protein [Kiritimatiellia bacterium]